MLDYDATATVTKEFWDMTDPQSAFEFLNDFSEVLVYSKNLEGRYVMANSAVVAWFGLPSQQNLLGKTDDDLLPKSHAASIQMNDSDTLQSGLALIDSIELLIDPIGQPIWFITSKYPIQSSARENIGITVVRKKYPFVTDNPLNDSVTNALGYIKRTYYREITIPYLAELTDLSVRQFERRFKQQMKLTPQDFIVRFRVFKACEPLLKTSVSLAEISKQCGFYDQAAFSKLFKKHLGISPLNYRQEFQLKTESY